MRLSSFFMENNIGGFNKGTCTSLATINPHILTEAYKNFSIET